MTGKAFAARIPIVSFRHSRLLSVSEARGLRRISTTFRVLAIIGVLLHAGLIVWHNAAMLGATLQRNALATALAELCHGAGAAATEAQGELPELPQPGNDQSGCPICKGSVSAVAILPTPDLQLHRPDRATARLEVVGRIIALRLQPVRPPTRGPPQTV